MVTQAPTDDNAHTIRLLGMEADEFDALATEHEVAMLQERVAELEFMSEDSGWERIDDTGTDLDLARERDQVVVADGAKAAPLVHGGDLRHPEILMAERGGAVNDDGVGAFARHNGFLMCSAEQRSSRPIRADPLPDTELRNCRRRCGCTCGTCRPATAAPAPRASRL
jgi:hypothetical protein